VTARSKDFPNHLAGTVWLAKDDTGNDAPQAVFMDDQAWKILQASDNEWKKRQGYLAPLRSLHKPLRLTKQKLSPPNSQSSQSTQRGAAGLND